MESHNLIGLVVLHEKKKTEICYSLERSCEGTVRSQEESSHQEQNPTRP